MIMPSPPPRPFLVQTEFRAYHLILFTWPNVEMLGQRPLIKTVPDSDQPVPRINFVNLTLKTNRNIRVPVELSMLSHNSTNVTQSDNERNFAETRCFVTINSPAADTRLFRPRRALTLNAKRSLRKFRLGAAAIIIILVPTAQLNY